MVLENTFSNHLTNPIPTVTIARFYISQYTKKMTQYLIYHNPRCRKSRESLQVLEEANLNFQVKLYLEEGLDTEEVEKLKESLGLDVLKFMRTKEPEFKAMGLSKETADNQLIQALTATPKLLERPIIVSSDSRAVIGRPVDQTKKFLGLAD